MEFHETVEDDDYALIISEEGKLKGLWVPLNRRGKQLPYSVVKICMNFYGVDPSNEFLHPPTIH